MTEKRFVVETDKNTSEVSVFDKLEKRYIMSLVCEAIDDFDVVITEFMNACAKLNKLWEQTQRFEKHNQELEKKNEQLKDKIDVLEDDNETYHKSLEILNLYTKRFIPTKCTNEFKDCKTNRYYWLDHEGNFEGCLELLNLLDCENEILKSENSQLKGMLTLYKEQVNR